MAGIRMVNIKKQYPNGFVAIVRHPQVFLFDEPLSNLDAKLRVKMRTELK